MNSVKDLITAYAAAHKTLCGSSLLPQYSHTTPQFLGKPSLRDLVRGVVREKVLPYTRVSQADLFYVRLYGTCLLPVRPSET